MALQRLKPQEAKRQLERSDALLVCAYDDRQKFQEYQVAGAMSLDELRSQEDSLPKDQELIFYCA